MTKLTHLLQKVSLNHGLSKRVMKNDFYKSVLTKVCQKNNNLSPKATSECITTIGVVEILSNTTISQMVGDPSHFPMEVETELTM